MEPHDGVHGDRPGPVLTLLLVVARMIHFLVVILCFYLSCPSRTCGGLDGVGSVVALLDGGHSNHPSQVLGVVAAGGEDGPLLSWWQRL